MIELESNIHQEIYRLLKKKDTSYANPLSSLFLGRALNVSASYVREQAHAMLVKGIIQVRRGPGGGYFIKGELEK